MPAYLLERAWNTAGQFCLPHENGALERHWILLRYGFSHTECCCGMGLPACLPGFSSLHSKHLGTPA